MTRKSGCTSDSLHVSPLSLILGSLRAMSRPRAPTGHLKPLGSSERCSQGLGRLIPCSYCLALSTRRRLISEVEPCLLSRGRLGKTCPPRDQEARGLHRTLGDSSPRAEELTWGTGTMHRQCPLSGVARALTEAECVGQPPHKDHWAGTLSSGFQATTTTTITRHKRSRQAVQEQVMETLKHNGRDGQAPPGPTEGQSRGS